MVGLLGALPGTPLHERMQQSGRLKPNAFEGDQCGYTNIVTAAMDAIVAEHPRSFGCGETTYDPWHYVPVLARKPRALRNGGAIAKFW